MTKRLHTPAPWSFGESNMVIFGKGTIIADFEISKLITDEECKANAALAVQSPKMADLLIRAESFISGFEDDDAQDESVNELLENIRETLKLAGVA